MSEKVVGRFAPSPTGRMHAGNIYAALAAWLVAKSQGGEIVLRIEDLDRERSKSEYIDAVQQDFEMLGLTWDRGPFFQHDRDEAYAAAFDFLKERGLIYPCYCTRADLHAASAPHRGEKLVYPGTCRLLSAEERAAKEASGRRPAMRLRTREEVISFHDSIQGDYSQNLERDCGDFLVRRSDQAFAYQLAVVVDDALSGVNEIVRGHDILSSTPRQRYLQRLLGFETPAYAHIPLLMSPDGRRLSKRDRDLDLGELRTRFGTPEALLGWLAGQTGIAPDTTPRSAEQLVEHFSWDVIRKHRENITVTAE